jgi:hypothetical protein
MSPVYQGRASQDVTTSHELAHLGFRVAPGPAILGQAEGALEQAHEVVVARDAYGEVSSSGCEERPAAKCPHAAMAAQLTRV